MKIPFSSITLAVILLVLASCAKEQSELSLSSMNSSTILNGKVEYVVGSYKTDNGTIMEDYKLPAAGRTVSVTIPSYNYVSGASGNQYFEVVTDQNGNYSISIPVSSQTLNATVDVLPFYSEKYFSAYDEFTVTSIPNALYNQVTASQSSVTLKQKEINTVDLVISSDTELPVVFDQTLEVSGTILVESWVVDEDYDTDSQNRYKKGTAPYANREAEVIAVQQDIQYNNGYPDYITEYVIRKTVTTNNQGEFNVTFTLPSDCWDKHVYFYSSTYASLEKNFTHRYYRRSNPRWYTQEFSVIYNESYSTSSYLGDGHKFLGLETYDCTVTVDPVPDIDEIMGVGKLEDDNGNTISYNNPFNWQ